MTSTFPSPMAFLVCLLQTLLQTHYTCCSLKKPQMQIHLCQKSVSIAHSLKKKKIKNQVIKMV